MAHRWEVRSGESVATTTRTGSRLTYDDYLAFPEDGRSHEIIAGVHYVSAAPFLDHQRISRHILFQLYSQVELPGHGEVFNAPTAVQISEHDVVEPDLLVVLAARDSYLTERSVAGPPDLIVEILSPSTRHKDRELKLDLYQRAGVDEYWIVDPAARHIVKHVRRGPILSPVGTFTDSIVFDGLPGVVVDLSRVWPP
jgi:Uma2 family endonuclease